MSLATQFVEILKGEIASCSLIHEEMFSTFDFTLGKERVCHARMTGLIVKAGWRFPNVAAVDVENDFKLTPKWSWKPDVVLRNAKGEVMLAVDFESPNSSDARIAEKDVKPFLEWKARVDMVTEYLIITSLPACEARWRLLYTSPGCYNESHKGRLREIAPSPLAYWYTVYRGQWVPTWSHITLANMDGLNLTVQLLNAENQ